MLYKNLPDEFPTIDAFQVLRDLYEKREIADKELAAVTCLNIAGFGARQALGLSNDPIPMHANSITSTADVKSAFDQACSPTAMAAIDGAGDMKAGGLLISILAPIAVNVLKQLLSGLLK